MNDENKKASTDLNSVADQLYNLFRSQEKLKMTDVAGNIVVPGNGNHASARKFEFQFKLSNGKSIPMNVKLDPEQGLIVNKINNIETDSNFIKFIQALKRKYNLFQLPDFKVADSLKPDDKLRSPIKETKNNPMNKLHGTSRASYQQIGETRLVIKHSNKIDETQFNSRIHNIAAIFIENSLGERFKYPLKHINGARAMAVHVDHGGTPYDQIGRHILNLSEELNQLRKFNKYITRQELLAETENFIEPVNARIAEIKKSINSLQRPSYYSQFAESFTNSQEVIIPESVLNDWIDRLTVRTFNEDLKPVFPYLYKLMGESAAPIKQFGSKQLAAFTNDGYSINHKPPSKQFRSNKPKTIKPVAENILNPANTFISVMEQFDLNQGKLFSMDRDIAAQAAGELAELMSERISGGFENINVSVLEDLLGSDNVENLKELIKDRSADIRPLIRDTIIVNDEDLAENLFHDEQTKIIMDFDGTGEAIIRGGSEQVQTKQSQPKPEKPQSQEQPVQETSSLARRHFRRRRLQDILKRSRRLSTMLESHELDRIIQLCERELINSDDDVELLPDEQIVDLDDFDEPEFDDLDSEFDSDDREFELDQLIREMN